MRRLLPLVLLFAACGGNPRPRPPAPPAPAPVATPTPFPEPPASPRPPKPEPTKGPGDDGSTPIPLPKPPDLGPLVWICHVESDGREKTKHVHEGSIDQWGTARWHIEKHAPKDYRGECGRKHKED